MAMIADSQGARYWKDYPTVGNVTRRLYAVRDGLSWTAYLVTNIGAHYALLGKLEDESKVSVIETARKALAPHDHILAMGESL